MNFDFVVLLCFDSNLIWFYFHFVLAKFNFVDQIKEGQGLGLIHQFLKRVSF
jgi:hypothetical protein